MTEEIEIKQSFLKKRINVFGKGIPVFALILLVLGVTGVTAALLEYYGVITTTVDVHQSIKLLSKDGQGVWQEVICTGTQGQGCEISNVILEESPGGEKFCFKHKLKNQMSVEGTVELETLYDPEHGDDGIYTTYYAPPMKTILILENKDSNWDVIVDDTQATLTFDTVGNNGEFNYELEAEGLNTVSEYAIIYYADKPDRFVNWGGDNPGKLIDTFTTDGNGDYSTLGVVSVDIGMNLPSENDANIDEYDYCAFDGYVHCYGAKIWIVPLSDYTQPALTTWNPSSYLFETDMITYFDCDLGVEYFLIDTLQELPVEEITIPSGEIQDFLVCYEFAEDIFPTQYTITTNIVPVVPV